MTKLSLSHLFVSILVVPLLMIISLGGCSQRNSTDTFISSFEGDAQVKKAGTTDWIEVEAKNTLEAGDSIKTGSNSKALIIFFDGSTIELKSDTQVEIMDLVQENPTSIRLKQDTGETLSKVRKLTDDNSRYEIETPAALANVRGSSMLVIVTTQGTIVQNLEGDIRVTAQGVELIIPEGESSTIQPDKPPEAPVPVTTTIQIPGTALSNPHFLVQSKPPTHILFSSISGILMVENQLLVVKNFDDEFIVIAWPYGYSLSTKGNRIQVIDEKGQPQARLGDYFTIGGGEIETGEFSKIIKTYGITLPSDYQGSIWIAAPTSETAYMPTQLAEFRDQPYPAEIISGNLKIEEDLILRLISQDGKSYLPIWPNTYYLSFLEQGIIRKYDDISYYFIFNNSPITLGGGEVTAETVEKYIGVSLPASWEGPYWLVSDVLEITSTP
jgi:hypothetical protein